MNLFSRLLIIFFLLMQGTVFSQKPDSTVYQIFDLIYNQQFDQAESMLKIQNGETDQFYLKVLKLDLFWWKYSISCSKTDARELISVMDQFNAAQPGTPIYKINQLIESSYRLRFEIKRFNLIGAVLLRSKVRGQIEELKKEKLPLNGSEQQLFQLYIILFQYFDLMLNPFFLDNQSEKRSNILSSLEKFTEDENPVISTMAHYFLGRIYMKLEKDRALARKHFVYLVKKYPLNRFFAEQLSNIS